MIKTTYPIMMLMAFMLTGCDLFDKRQNQIRTFVKTADKEALRAADRYKPEKVDIDEIKNYKGYKYNGTLKDPFTAREFVIKDKKLESPGDKILPVVKTAPNPVCHPPECVPPEPHPKALLENYNLSSLTFVGTMKENKSIGLIKTPDLGILPIKIGGYMGKNFGKVLEISESSLVLREKIQSGGLWKDKKTVLVIKQ